MKKFILITTYPLKLLLLGIVYFYKVIISPVLPNTCRFNPTCSTYMIQAINQFGIFKGVVLGVKRLSRCVPGGGSGFDPVPLNIKGELKWLL
jgi:putative membrane protein insertion efficiency factor